MSTIAPARNVVDWVSGAWFNIRAQSRSTGVAILDAAAGIDNQLGGGLSIRDMSILASTLSNIQINLIEGQGAIAGQAALDRIKKEITAKIDGSRVDRRV